MAKAPKKVLSDYELQFLARTWAARNATGKTQEGFAPKLKERMEQDHYKQFETRSMLKHDLVCQFLALTKVSFEWLFSGIGEGPEWRERYEDLKQKQVLEQRAVKRAKRAA